MANNKRIQILRGRNIKDNATELMAGQPVYDTEKNILRVGKGGETIANTKPLNVEGTAVLGTTTGITDTTDRQPDHIFEENSNTVKNATNTLKINNLEINQDENGILKIGDVIIPQKKAIIKNLNATATSGGEQSFTLNLTGIQLEQNKHYKLYGKWEAGVFTTDIIYDLYTTNQSMYTSISMNVLAMVTDYSVVDFCSVTVDLDSSNTLRFQIANNNGKNETFKEGNKVTIKDIYEIIE